MIQRLIYKDSVWVDLIKPTEDEVKKTANEFGIDLDTSNELLSPTGKARVDLHKNYLYVILHFPAFKHSHTIDTKQEIDFILGKDFIITARYDTIDAMDKFSKLVEVNSILDRGWETGGTGIIFFGLVREIYQSISHELASMEDWVSQIEEGIFMGKEKDMVFSLSDVSRNLLNFKKITSFHRDVLNSLGVFGPTIFGENFLLRVREITDEYSKVENLIKNTSDSLTELRETNNSLLSTKQNEIMKVLTIMAFVTFPLSLIASIFGMNTSFIPIAGMENDFWIVLSIMAIATIFMFIFFKYRKWL